MANLVSDLVVVLAGSLVPNLAWGLILTGSITQEEIPRNSEKSGFGSSNRRRFRVEWSLSGRTAPRNRKEFTMKDEIISAELIVKSPRGRKKVLDKDLLTKLAALAPGQAIALKSMGPIPKDLRQDVSAKIRKHFVEAHGTKPSINYTPDGFAQVSFAKRA